MSAEVLPSSLLFKQSKIKNKFKQLKDFVNTNLSKIFYILSILSILFLIKVMMIL